MALREQFDGEKRAENAAALCSRMCTKSAAWQPSLSAGLLRRH